MNVGRETPASGRACVGVALASAISQVQFVLLVHDGFLQDPDTQVSPDAQSVLVLQVLLHDAKVGVAVGVFVEVAPGGVVGVIVGDAVGVLVGVAVLVGVTVTVTVTVGLTVGVSVLVGVTVGPSLTVKVK